METQHKTAITTFVQCGPKGEESLNYHATSLSQSSQPRPEDRLIDALTNFFDQRNLATIEQINPHKSQRRVHHDDAPSACRSSASTGSNEDHETFKAGDSSASTDLPPSEDDMPVNLAKRKRGFNRVAFAKEAPAMPIHDVRMSGKITGQMKAIE